MLFFLKICDSHFLEGSDDKLRRDFESVNESYPSGFEKPDGAGCVDMARIVDLGQYESRNDRI